MMRKTAFVTVTVMAAVCAFLAQPAVLSAQELIRVGSYDSLGYPTGVMVRGDYAYVSDNILGLVILNVADSSAPYVAGRYDFPWWIFDMEIWGDTVYVATGYTEPYIGVLYILDVSDKSNPYLLGSIAFQWEATVIAISIDTIGNQDYAYISGYSGDKIIDISNPAAPIEVGQFTVPGSPSDMICRGSYIYATVYDQGLQILSIADRVNPQWVGGSDTPGRALDIAISSYAYVADGDSGISIIRIEDLSNPIRLRNIRTPARATDLAAGLGCMLAAAVGDSGVALFDITGGEFIPIDMVRGPGQAMGVDADDEHVYLVAGEALDIFSLQIAPCNYEPGEINGIPPDNGIDIIYAVTYFKGGAPPPLSCYCPPHGFLFVGGDVNGDCVFNGIDVTYYVGYLKGHNPNNRHCPACPPAE
jgi:hypothetical protein